MGEVSAAVALKTPTRNGYTAQGVNLTFRRLGQTVQEIRLNRKKEYCCLRLYLAAGAELGALEDPCFRRRKRL